MFLEYVFSCTDHSKERALQYGRRQIVRHKQARHATYSRASEASEDILRQEVHLSIVVCIVCHNHNKERLVMLLACPSIQEKVRSSPVQDKEIVERIREVQLTMFCNNTT